MRTLRQLLDSRATGESHRVTTLELFFDLVYVFAFTQVTFWMAHEHSWLGSVQGLLILAVLWWSWVAWAWTGNVVRADRGAPLYGIVVSMAAIFVVSLTIGTVWTADAGTLAPMAFAAGYLTLRVVHSAAYAWAVRKDAKLLRQVKWTSAAWIPAAALLFVGAALPPEARLWWWAGVLLLDLVSTWIISVTLGGWQIRSGEHIAERFGLIVILALGESVLALGFASESIELTVHAIAIGVLGVLTALALWWPYFKDIGPSLESAIHSAKHARKVDIARDAYTYMHLPLVMGIILAAAGIEEAVLALEDNEQSGVAATMLAAGAALFSLTGAALMKMAGGTWKWLALSAAFFVLAAWWMPALDSMVAIAITMVVLVAVGVVTPSGRHQAPSVVGTA